MSPNLANTDKSDSDFFNEVIELLKARITEIHRKPVANMLAEDLEKSLHEVFVEAERKVIERTLSQYDIDIPVVFLNGTPCRRVTRCEKTYMSSAGLIRIERSLYRKKGETTTVCPFELSAGVIAGYWTPRAAKQGLLAVSHLTPYEAEDLLGEMGAMKPSRSSLDRLPKSLGEKWESNREKFELSLSQHSVIPEEAKSVAVSLDGVKIPMQGGVALPGDSRYEEASCGSVTYYNAEGEPLSTRRYGRMPESGKVTMKSFLAEDIGLALRRRPDLQLVKVADGAKDNWTFLDNQISEGISVLDFYHAAEHLKSAFDLIHGKESPKSQEDFIKWRHILRHDQRGIGKVIRNLENHVKNNPKKSKLKTELNYFKINKRRCRYAKIAKNNLPIGSGVVEATCKALVTQRLKRSGMAWQTEGGQSVLTFRALQQSGLFNQGWTKVSAEYRENISSPENLTIFQKMLRKIVSMRSTPVFFDPFFSRFFYLAL